MSSPNAGRRHPNIDDFDLIEMGVDARDEVSVEEQDEQVERFILAARRIATKAKYCDAFHSDLASQVIALESKIKELGLLLEFSKGPAQGWVELCRTPEFPLSPLGKVETRRNMEGLLKQIDKALGLP